MTHPSAARLPRPRHLTVVPDLRPRFGTPVRPLRRTTRRQAPGQLSLDQVIGVAQTLTGRPLFVLPGGLLGQAPEPTPVANVVQLRRIA